MIDKNSPIGIFDSGLGGLTVFKAVRRLMPAENLIYFGDTARVPYGTKSREAVIAFSREIAAMLSARGVKLLIVACNTASSLALEEARKVSRVPVIGVIEPGPCHRKTARVDNDLADLVKQIFFIMNTHDCLVGRGKHRVESGEGNVLGIGPAVINSCPDLMHELRKLGLWRPALLEVKISTAFERLDGDLFPPFPGKNNKGDELVGITDFFQKLDAIHSRHLVIGDNSLEPG